MRQLPSLLLIKTPTRFLNRSTGAGCEGDGSTSSEVTLDDTPATNSTIKTDSKQAPEKAVPPELPLRDLVAGTETSLKRGREEED